MIPIHKLGGLKSIPHSSRTSVYTFIMEDKLPPPPPCPEHVQRDPSQHIYVGLTLAQRS